MFASPRKTYAILGVLLVACWFLSGVGGERTPDDGGLYYVGMVFWVGFGLMLVATVLFTVAVLIRSVRSRSLT